MHRNINCLCVLAKEITARVNSMTRMPVSYVSVRHQSRFHKHITYSYHLIKQKKIFPPGHKFPIDVKSLGREKPVTPSVILGDMSKARQFKFDVESLNSRGFLRFQKSYDPPKDVQEKIIQLCKSCLNAEENDQRLMAKSLGDSRKKFELLTKAHNEFQHAVPNSMLHMMNTVGDIVEFYCTPIKTLTPYEELMRNPDLPRNIHIQKKPLRFHPDTDTLFNGQTAYNKNSTIVTGLRAKKKYPGYEAKMTWP